VCIGPLVVVKKNVAMITMEALNEMTERLEAVYGCKLQALE
jgi:hypothetical protein